MSFGEFTDEMYMMKNFDFFEQGFPSNMIF